MMSKILVAYFSASGTTAGAARELAKAAGADLYEIRPAVPYTRADLNWQDENSRSTREMKDKTSRPALADTDAPIRDYDMILLGFPIWWYTAPAIISSFLEAYDFSGKKIVLFATSGGSGFENAARKLKASVAKDAVLVEGRMMNRRNSAEELKRWLDSVLA